MFNRLNKSNLSKSDLAEQTLIYVVLKSRLILSKQIHKLSGLKHLAAEGDRSS